MSDNTRENEKKCGAKRKCLRSFILYNSMLVFFLLHRIRMKRKVWGEEEIGLILHRMRRKVWGEEEEIGLTPHRMMKRKVKV